MRGADHGSMMSGGRGRLRSALLLTVIAIASVAGCGESTDVASAPAVEAAPVATADVVEFLDGGQTTLEALRGRHVFVNYWAEWCAPCLEEIPELNELHEDAGVFVLGINYDRLEPEVMRPQVEALGIHFPVAIDDPAELLGVSTPEVLPSTFVFGPDGSRVTVLRGPQTLEKLRAAMTGASADAPGVTAGN